MTEKSPHPIKCTKSNEVVRFLTFNVNGLRTLFHYRPFSEMSQSLESVFNYFDSDIITFQELKTERLSITKWGKVPGFYSFISIPQFKKGYSGVGCWIRILREDHPLHDALQVVKAEEGITGFLSIKVGNSNIRYRDDCSVGIGGYESLGLDNNDMTEALKIDTEGRCVMVELACNIVVISVYCPANSTSSEDGEILRVKFLRVLFKRIRNLDKIGKRVLLMGDLNICRDLTDHAEALEKNSIIINNNMEGIRIENTHKEQCHFFVINPETAHRRMLNQMLADSIIPEMAEEGILIDTTRLIQSRNRLKMYTVWNTLKNTRPLNYGSRIDFILTSLGMKNGIQSADILPEIMGSDHCPVFADINLKRIGSEVPHIKTTLPRFEARYKFGLMHGNVLDLFNKSISNDGAKPVSAWTKPSNMISKKRAVAPSKSIDNFFRKAKLENPTTSVIEQSPVKRSSSRENAKVSIKDIFGKPPLCEHGVEAILRTSKTSANPGKRFWLCKLPKGSSNDKSSSCGFFQWA